MISAIINRGQMVFLVVHGTLRALLFVDFVRRLQIESARKVYLIVYGHPVHRSRLAKDFAAEHATDFRLIQLPDDCPELNPDELLNHDVTTNALTKIRPRYRTEMMSDVLRHFFLRQKQHRVIQNLCREQHV